MSALKTTARSAEGLAWAQSDPMSHHPATSASGQSRRFGDVSATPALPPASEKHADNRIVLEVPIADVREGLRETRMRTFAVAIRLGEPCSLAGRRFSELVSPVISGLSPLRARAVPTALAGVVENAARGRFVKDPATGKRVTRYNSSDQLVIQDVPSLRIVSDDLWQNVKDRQLEIRERVLSEQTAVRSERARHPNSIATPSGTKQLRSCGA
jgi:hypothetical protein